MSGEWVEKRTSDGRRYLERRIDDETVERRFTDTEDRISSHGGTAKLATDKRSFSHLASPQAMPTIVGRFAVFNEWTVIRDREGHYLERIAPNAFDRTIVEDRPHMRCLYEHGHDPSIGTKPLGPIEDLRVQADGPHYAVPLFDAGYTRELLPGLQAGVYGASFRFRPVADTFKVRPGKSAHNPDAIPERTLTDVRVLEFGPCTFPAYAGATAGVAEQAAPESAPRSAITVREQSGPAVCDVRLMPSVIDEIRHAALWTTGIDGLESGGWLAGSWVGDAVVVTKATRSNEKRSRDHLKLSLEGRAAISLFEQWGRDFGLIGLWHTHPDDDWRASESDFESFELAHRHANTTRHEPYGLGIIAVPDESGSYAWPRLHAWVSTREGDRYVTRPARLVEA